MTARLYVETDKIHDIICDEPTLLQMMCRFGIPMGVGEKSVRDVCVENNVDTITFLAVANFIKHGEVVAQKYVNLVSVESLVNYLQQAHNFFLDFQLPSIRRKLLEAIDCSINKDDVSFLILKFYDEYIGQVRKHMSHENKKVFTYVRQLLTGTRTADFEISLFAKSHIGIDKKLQELKNIIIKYYSPTEKVDLLHSVLLDIFNCEKDLRIHCEVEDALFVPAVQLLESNITISNDVSFDEQNIKEVLSDREKEILSAIVRGLTNKEIADLLFISVNTVLTHRKNISKKLNIRSVSGLTIYAIVHQIVDIKELNSNISY